MIHNENDSSPINHLNHPLALLIRSLLDRSDRAKLKKILIDDEENILEALEAGIEIETLISSDVQLLSPKLMQKIPSSIPVVALAHRTAKKIFGTERISRLLAIAKMPTLPPLESLLNFDRDIIVLDQLSISGNIGAIIRTAFALHSGSLVLLDHEETDLFDRRIIRSSRGYLFHLPILVAKTEEFIHFCRDNNIKILGTSSHASQSIDEVAKEDQRLAITFGREKEGCSLQLQEAASLLTKIPISHQVESLNVSVSASIILYLRNLHYRQKD